MKDSLIADAWLKHYHGDMSDHNIRVTFAAERAWNASARVIIAQMKPFFDQYQFLRDKTEHGSLEETAASIRLDEVYDDVVEPLLKELEE